MKLTGAEILVKCLLEQQVDTIFGYPGGKVIDIYDALHKEPKITHILTAHDMRNTVPLLAIGRLLKNPAFVFPDAREERVLTDPDRRLEGREILTCKFGCIGLHCQTMV